ncbi:magnesium transporter [Vibrio parahaemolyticus]|uniref:magnesium transporter n=1 Tax=Vibrio parahaemolyticus TaxID=670 RepID=UPI0004133BBB|nr:magnesium transporter [Vibrio parahaemolyticus]EJG1709182.1 magnesium transporter [Vibrio parahaemolyticus]EJG1741100.1 magnesium transporter [Vibrio parahaemolyticus]EJG1778468.1 magnesium transporter [Vibrio parahaemolyticus]MDZ5175765.1 magnesium transporter [Vibrio parahaemolyticus]SUQ09019.1 Mg transporter MgtE [Vibrio parahaemolyticus]
MMIDSSQLQINRKVPHLLAEIIKAIESTEDLSFLKDYQEAQIANILESVNIAYRKRVIEAVPPEKYWTVFNLLRYDTAKHIHQSLNKELQHERLAYITDSELIIFADFLPTEFVDEYLIDQSEESVAHIQQALSYEDNKVGRYAEPHFLVANPKNSVGGIKTELLKRGQSPVRLIIVRDVGGVIGTIEPQTLLLHENHTKLTDLTVVTPILEDIQTIQSVSKQVSIDGGAHWFPIMAGGKIMGVLSMATIAITLLTAFVASAIIGIFDNVVEQVVALAILMPVVASMGGIAGSQTLAVAIRGIALNHLHQSNLKLLVNKELKIATINGLIMGLVIAGVVYMVFDSWPLALIICCAIFLNSLAAAASGTLIPFTLKKFNIDPAVAGSVVLTTVTDVVGFFAFLGLGAIFLI